ncbi:TIGR01777 family protein [Legionella israelensis]|uniref:TIGR01777 family protein n=2 Tax=Legionella israelensis TaxID=454 RepID=A0AAX1EI07_9GAMM|nr:TIGR01777 family oxidoreductase [Legionella israelensis]QBR84778.1 TIGR01777 family protein [Legionella israelensis]
MVKSVHALIVGGGISGLTLANLLIHGNKKIKYHVTLFESRPYLGCKENNIAGGIGIWPPSQSVLRNIPNYQRFMKQFAYFMPSPSYRDSKGRILARANEDFGDRFPVQCLERYDLINLLSAGLKNRKDVEIITSQKICEYERYNNQIGIRVDKKLYKGDLLIACDGIRSKIRNCLMSELERPPVFETDLGYTYFRANTKLPIDTKYKWWSVSFETWGTCKSKKFGNYEIRFGYVPLKPPTVFWFIAVKTQNNHKYLSPIKGVKLVDEETKEFLLELVRSWKPIYAHPGEVAVDYEELINLTYKILRTDIAKIEGLDKFPWTSRDRRVLLMGDSAHATAPNIAQGAGLCIEDAACLVSKLNRVDYLQGLSEYEQERKPRAKTVQNVADFIATAGQVKNPLLKTLRNRVLRATTLLTPMLQRRIFEYVVSYSLGGSTKARFWQAPPLFIVDDAPTSLIARVFPDFLLLDNHIKDFKTSKTGGSGFGVVTIEKPTFLSKLIGFFAGFPKEMQKQPFYAEVFNLSQDFQLWRRIFGYKTPLQKTYQTTHSLYCRFNRCMYLSEGFGGYLDKVFQFIYNIKFQSDKSLMYESQGITFFDSFKIPIPSFLSPKSVWTEKPIEKGWEFDGRVSFPIIGTLFHYYGYFQIEQTDSVKNGRVIIAGGSGMIGREVCLEFIKKGYDVYCLSRSSNTRLNIEGVKVRLIDEDWSDLIDKNTIILNLSGANPGAKRWTLSVKSEIATSRFRVIDTIIHNIDRAQEKPLKYLQASAVGFYGHAGDAVLTEESEPIPGGESGTKFRVKVCKEIERRAEKAKCNVIHLRIGHVLSNTGGLLHYLRLSGFFYVGKFGSGNQFVPFVHIQDVARAIEFIAHNRNIIDGAINITAPKPCRNYEMLKELRLVKWGQGLPMPKSVLKLLIGQSSVVLTDSEQVQPKRLLERGFEFNYKTIQEALHGLQ